MPYEILSVRQKTHDGTLIDGVADEVIMRIRKILDRAESPTTPAAEADQAMRLAKRELTRANLERDDVVSATDSVGLADKGAMWVVAIASDARKPVPVFEWLRALLCTIAYGFHVGTYTSRCRDHTEIVFYGMARSAEVGARAFKAYFVRADQMARDYVVRTDKAMAELEADFRKRVVAGELGFAAAMDQFRAQRTYLLRTFTRQGHDCYRVGLARGLRSCFGEEELTERARVAELEIRAEKERRARVQRAQAEQARARWREQEAAHLMSELAAGRDGDSIAPLVVDVDDDDFDLEEAEREIAASRALVVYSREVARAVLVEHGVKLSRYRRATFATRNLDSYEDGKRDSKRLRQAVGEEGF